MKFKLDENLPVDLSALLRGGGHDARSVLDERLGGAADPTVAKVCQDEQRILITLDLDFANIRAYPPQDYHGIIVLRLAHQDRNTVAAMIPRVLALLQTEHIIGKLWIVDEARTRIRDGVEQMRAAFGNVRLSVWRHAAGLSESSRGPLATVLPSAR